MVAQHGQGDQETFEASLIVKASPLLAPLHSCVWPTIKAFSKCGHRLCSPFLGGKCFFILLVDTHSKCPEVFIYLQIPPLKGQ